MELSGIICIHIYELQTWHEQLPSSLLPLLLSKVRVVLVLRQRMYDRFTARHRLCARFAPVLDRITDILDQEKTRNRIIVLRSPKITGSQLMILNRRDKMNTRTPISWDKVWVRAGIGDQIKSSRVNAKILIRDFCTGQIIHNVIPTLPCGLNFEIACVPRSH